MMSQRELKDVTVNLTQALTEYEVIPANSGWHIHKGDEYYGHLEYQEKIGWKGSALNKLPTREKEQLKNWALSELSQVNNRLVTV